MNDELSEILSREALQKGWRPGLAALRIATADRDLWMTPEEFDVFWAREFPHKARLGPKSVDQLGMTREQANARRSGNVIVSSTEALACAHYALRFPIPDAFTTEEFRFWFEARFGDPAGIADWLGEPAYWMREVLDGYHTRGDRRYDRPPTIPLLRALDWVARVGPVCPYGERRRSL